jgi:hypothetical protein
MGEEELVATKVSDSVALIKALEVRGFVPASAVWYYLADAREWRLLLGGPRFDDLLPKAELRAYKEVAEALGAAQVESLTIAEVKLVRTDHALLRVTRLVIRTEPEALVRAHFIDCVFNGFFVKEMLVLRSS